MLISYPIKPVDIEKLLDMMKEQLQPAGKRKKVIEFKENKAKEMSDSHDQIYCVTLFQITRKQSVLKRPDS
jgi:hypothetical protein